MFTVNLGGEGEVSAAVNQNLPLILAPSWRSARHGLTLRQLQVVGNVFVVSSNEALPFRDGSIDEVLTNSVPIDRSTWLGSGVSSHEVHRIMKPHGRWLHDGGIQE